MISIIHIAGKILPLGMQVRKHSKIPKINTFLSRFMIIRSYVIG